MWCTIEWNPLGEFTLCRIQSDSINDDFYFEFSRNLGPMKAVDNIKHDDIGRDNKTLDNFDRDNIKRDKLSCNHCIVKSLFLHYLN